MLIHVPPIPFIGRRKRRIAAQVAPAALTLVAVEYDPAVSVTLTFDRAIDVAGLVGAAVTVDDEGAVTHFAGLGAITLTGPETVEIALMDVSEFLGSGTTLTATAANGIVAAGDGAAWAGVTGVAIPFP